ncbi:uncharacterized protein LOC142824233 [Pelodiscus sinensis]|uniref:uncharacterized protein LOC142824233 n=1 Tax=Pelodiscus sinensis TaxID=13735 RepID=UPI003F6D68A3
MGASVIWLLPSRSSNVTATSRPLRNLQEQKMSSLLLQRGHGKGLSGRCITSPLDGNSTLCIPTNSADPESNSENQRGFSPCHSSSASLDKTTVVSIPPQNVPITTMPLTSPPRPPLPEPGITASPQTREPSPDSVVHKWFGVDEQLCSEAVKTVLLNSRRQTTRSSYVAKWKRFVVWCGENDTQPHSAPMHTILDYILSLHQSGLSMSTLRVHLSAITAFHSTIGGHSVFTHPMTKRLLKGIANLKPPRRPIPPSWNLDLVLDALLYPPFEPLATTSLPMLNSKVVFLLAITSSRRVSELAALMATPSYTVFTKDSVTLRTHPAFIPKVATQFHVNEPVVLPVFYPKPHTSNRDSLLHTLDVRRALAFYIDRTRAWRKTDRLIVSIADRSKDNAFSSQRLSNIIVSCITMCHTMRNKPLQTVPRAHSTRAMATSTAFARGVSLSEICRAATWSSNLPFVNHYAIVRRWIPESSVSSAVFSVIDKPELQECTGSTATKSP